MNSITKHTRVVYFVPFRPERAENLIPVCKPIRDNPPFHLGLNFGVFRPFWWILGCFWPIWAFQPVCFLGDFVFIFFLSPLDFSDLSTSSSCQPALTPAVSQPDAAAGSSVALCTQMFCFFCYSLFFILLRVYPDCFVSFSFYVFFFFFTILFCVAFIPPSLQSNFFNFQNLPTTSLGVSHLQFTNDYLCHFVISSCRNY